MIDVQVNGKVYNGFTRVSFKSSIEDLCNQFSLECSSDGSNIFPIPRGSEIEVFVEEQKVMTGVVELIDGEYSSDSYRAKIDGRDKTKSILKTDLPPKFVIKGPIQLDALMRKTLDTTEIQLDIIDETGGIDEFTDREICTDDTGGTIWDFWVAMAEKRQVLITKNNEGQIVIRSPNDQTYNLTLRQNLVDPENRNNILKAKFKFDDSERRREYNVYSQANVAVQRKDPPPSPTDYFTPEYQSSDEQDTSLQNQGELEKLQKELSNATPGSELERSILEQIRAIAPVSAGLPTSKRVQTSGRAIDNAGDPGSVSHETAENPSDDDECQRLASWNCNRARVDSVTYSCTVEQLLVDGEPWRAGVLIPVIDEIASIDSLMLINSVEFFTEVSEGGNVQELVNLTLTIPDAYSENATATDSEVQTSIMGENWNIGGFN